MSWTSESYSGRVLAGGAADAVPRRSELVVDDAGTEHERVPPSQVARITHPYTFS